jgi:hypothetical protein
MARGRAARPAARACRPHAGRLGGARADPPAPPRHEQLRAGEEQRRVVIHIARNDEGRDALARPTDGLVDDTMRDPTPPHLHIQGEVWRSEGPPLTVPGWDGVVRWCATRDGSRWGVQWRDLAAAPVRLEADIAFEVLQRLERDHDLTYKREGRSWRPDLPWFTILPPPPSRVGDARGRPRWGVRLRNEMRWWIWTPSAELPLDALVWRLGYDRDD